MKTATITLLTLLCISSVTFASEPVKTQQKIVIKDSAGRISQSSTITPGKVTIRDNRGTITGILSVKGGSAQYRNNRGQIATPLKGKK